MTNEWLPFPTFKPNDEQGEYVVLSPNPNYINKSLYQQNTPRFHREIAIWTHNRFVNDLLQELVVSYWIQLPALPEKK